MSSSAMPVSVGDGSPSRFLLPWLLLPPAPRPALSGGGGCTNRRTPPSFPIRNGSGDDPKQGVWVRDFDRADRPISAWRARAKFRFEPPPFVQQLSLAHREFSAVPAGNDFFGPKMVVAPRCFMHDGDEVFAERSRRCPGTLEAIKLRVVLVALGFAAQYFLREQSFAPQRGQSLSIEIFRMEGPETQWETSAASTVRNAPACGRLRPIARAHRASNARRRAICRCR